MQRDLMTPTNDEGLTAIIDTLRAIQPTPLAETRVLCAGRVDEDAAWLREHGYLVEAIDADGVRAQLITPPGAALDQGILVAFHGGGFIVCSAATHAKAFGLMGAASRLRVLNVDYRLAPEHRFPAAHDDCLRATRWAARALHRDVVLIGDSVGGNLSLSVGAQLIGEADVTVRRPRDRLHFTAHRLYAQLAVADDAPRARSVHVLCRVAGAAPNVPRRQ